MTSHRPPGHPAGREDHSVAGRAHGPVVPRVVHAHAPPSAPADTARRSAALRAEAGARAALPRPLRLGSRRAVLPAGEPASAARLRRLPPGDGARRRARRRGLGPVAGRAAAHRRARRACSSIVLVALCARELGGGFRSQLLASLAFALTPYGLGLGVLFHPTMLDVPVWVAFSYVALRILGRPEPRLLPVLGLVAGIGLETKDTVIALLGVFLLALLLLGPRDALRDRRALARPGDRRRMRRCRTSAWQIAHGWPSLAFLGTQAAKTAERHAARHLHRRADRVPGGSAPARRGRRRHALAASRALRALAVTGARRRPRSTSSSRDAATTRFLPWRSRSRPGSWSRGQLARAVAAPARGVASDRGAARSWCSRSWPRWSGRCCSERSMVERGVWRDSFYKDEIGWPELADQTARAWRAIPPASARDTALLAQNYGEAGALAPVRPARGPADAAQRPSLVPVLAAARLPQQHVLAVGVDRSISTGCARAGASSRASTTAGSSATRNADARSLAARCAAGSAISGRQGSRPTVSRRRSSRVR